MMVLTDQIIPAVWCPGGGATGNNTIQLIGDGFIIFDGNKPGVGLDGVQMNPIIDGCTDVAVRLVLRVNSFLTTSDLCVYTSVPSPQRSHSASVQTITIP